MYTKSKTNLPGAEPSGVEQLKDGFVFWLASTNVDFHRFALDSFTIL